MAKTIEQIQSMITNKADAREVINEIADYLQAAPLPAPGEGSSYLVYKVVLGVAGSSNGVPTVVSSLENTLGDIVWTREDVGFWKGTLAGAFTAGKTVCPPFDTGGSVILPLSGSTLYDNGYQVLRLSDNEIGVYCYSSDYNPKEFYEAIGINNNNGLLIEIQVYQ